MSKALAIAKRNAAKLKKAAGGATPTFKERFVFPNEGFKSQEAGDTYNDQPTDRQITIDQEGGFPGTRGDLKNWGLQDKPDYPADAYPPRNLRGVNSNTYYKRGGATMKKDPVRETIKRQMGGLIPGERAFIPHSPRLGRLGSNDSMRTPSLQPAGGAMRPPHMVNVMHSNVGMRPPSMPHAVKPTMPKMPGAGMARSVTPKMGAAKSIMPKAAGTGMVHPPHAGMIHSTIPGRTDKIPMGVKGGSYVVPADVVSGIGEGNSMAGANAFNKLFKMGPYGAGMNKIATPKVNMGHMGGMARPMSMRPANPMSNTMEEGGTPGDQGDHIPIIAAGGEFVIPPDRLRAVIHPDLKKAHDVMDKLVLHIRKKTVHQTRKLAPPKKN